MSQPVQQLRTTLGLSGIAHSKVAKKIVSLSDLQALAGACDMFTGAELAGLCREAAITALREDLQVQYPYLLLTNTPIILLLLLFQFAWFCFPREVLCM